MLDHLIAQRASAIQASGIRRIFNLAQSLDNPINLSIGQPDFPVPEPIRAAARDAIEDGRNGYTLTFGSADLLAKVNGWLKTDLGWDAQTSGQAGEGQASTM